MLSHLYIGKGLMFRILLWGFPVAWLTALYVQRVCPDSDLLTLFIVALIPTLAMFSLTFSLPQNIVPEIEMLFASHRILAPCWDLISRILSLIFIAVVFTVMEIYVLFGLIEPYFNLCVIGKMAMESLFWGRIHVDLEPCTLLKVSISLSLTVFCACIISEVPAHFLHLIRFFRTFLPETIRRLFCAPAFVLISTFGVIYVSRLESFGAALMLSIVPALAISQTMLRQLPDMVPELGELVMMMDKKIEQPLDLPGVLKWIGRKIA